jgi:hypothetical protein
MERMLLGAAVVLGLAKGTLMAAFRAGESFDIATTRRNLQLKGLFLPHYSAKFGEGKRIKSELERVGARLMADRSRSRPFSTADAYLQRQGFALIVGSPDNQFLSNQSYWIYIVILRLKFDI